MKPILILTAILLFLVLNSGCEKPSAQLCGGDNPDKNLPWLKAKIETLSTSPFCNSISRSTYKNQTVFIQASCDPLANSINLFFNCEGIELNLTVKEYQNLILTGPTELIWKSK